jgi:hypothetical protein
MIPKPSVSRNSFFSGLSMRFSSLYKYNKGNYNFTPVLSLVTKLLHHSQIMIDQIAVSPLK